MTTEWMHLAASSDEDADLDDDDLNAAMMDDCEDQLAGEDRFDYVLRKSLEWQKQWSWRRIDEERKRKRAAAQEQSWLQSEMKEEEFRKLRQEGAALRREIRELYRSSSSSDESDAAANSQRDQPSSRRHDDETSPSPANFQKIAKHVGPFSSPDSVFEHDDAEDLRPDFATMRRHPQPISPAEHLSPALKRKKPSRTTTPGSSSMAKSRRLVINDPIERLGSTATSEADEPLEEAMQWEVAIPDVPQPTTTVGKRIRFTKLGNCHRFLRRRVRYGEIGCIVVGAEMTASEMESTMSSSFATGSSSESSFDKWSTTAFRDDLESSSSRSGECSSSVSDATSPANWSTTAFFGGDRDDDESSEFCRRLN